MRKIYTFALLFLSCLANAQSNLPYFSLELNKKLYRATEAKGVLSNSLRFEVKSQGEQLAEVWLENTGTDTIEIRNLVPFGVSQNYVYITGLGEHGLSRTHLFIPGKSPVNVICPDNAWELGAAFVKSNNQQQVAALARRDRSSLKKGQRRRFETILFPGGSIRYILHYENYQGEWQEGLRVLFHDKMLYDTIPFDNRLFERKDLQWIRHSYVMHLMQAWDKFFYQENAALPLSQRFHLKEFMGRGKKLYGGDEVIGIWPTWPSLGLDQRNQFDLFRDLPGGTKQLKKISNELRAGGTKFFICYNPWDESTRNEGHLAGLGDLIKATEADGVVLDTRGASSKELQQAADEVRPGVIMYSEGMAVPKDMINIVSGRVHNALYYPPMLNLNKMIKPEFAIFRVAELYKEPIRREFATSFFSGYGTELNIFAPGQPDWVEEQYKYLGQTSRILRENTYNFTNGRYTPLIPTTRDSIWVNQWKLPSKTIYTIYSIIPQGYNGTLFEVSPLEGYHFADLWNHELREPTLVNGKYFIEAETHAFDQKYLGTNNEGEVGCIAQLPSLIYAHLEGDQLTIESPKGKELLIWAGNPDYSKTPLRLASGSHKIALSEKMGRFEGKFVIQLMEEGILQDETLVYITAGTPRLISRSAKSTSHSDKVPEGMVAIPAGRFVFRESHGDEFIPYPKQFVDSSFDMKAFYMDRFPVTNLQFKKFLDATHYRPADSSNFLKHWPNKRIRTGEEDFPVIYVSYEDAQAYAKWAGKRLPTELEWQYAAQTAEGNEWPWKQSTPVRRKEEVVTETLTVTSIEGIDSSLCNLGNGKLYRVGSYPAGANPFGLQDLVGCVWQLTNDVYMNGSYQYILLKGGSYFKPSSSWWYVQSGPRELHYRQFLLRVSPGFERNATVGFRCVK